jgi:hypothetical protein
MRTANWAAAADYINQMYGHGLNPPMASLDTLTMSQPGVIEFKIKRGTLGANTFVSLDRLVNRVSAVHGVTHTRDLLHNGKAYIWTITSERSVVVGYRNGKGVYIQLKDTGN